LLDELEERRLLTTVVSHGGPIIPNVQVEAVFYGSAWTNPADPNYDQMHAYSSDIARYLSTITGSYYLQSLSEYTMVNSAGQTLYAASGQYVGADFVSGSLDPASPVVDENTFRTLLPTEVNSGRLQAPSANTLYMIFLAPNVTLHADWDANAHNAFHDAFKDSSGRVFYFAPVANPLGNSNSNYANAAWAKGLTPFQALTEISSHEMVEAITNPIANTPSGFMTGSQGWYENNPPSNESPGEIGDIAAADLPGLRQASRVDGYVVQKYWSQVFQTDYAPGGQDFQPMQQLPNLSSLNFSFANSPRGASGQLLLTSYYNVTAQSASFDGTWGSTGDAVYGNLWVDGSSDQVYLTVYRLSDSTQLFSGIITAPDGNWSLQSRSGSTGGTDYLEISGSAMVNGSYLSVYGTGYYYSTSPYGGSFGGGGGGSGGGYPYPPRHPAMQ
jgi:hypothetical protein